MRLYIRVSLKRRMPRLENRGPRDRAGGPAGGLSSRPRLACASCRPSPQPDSMPLWGHHGRVSLGSSRLWSRPRSVCPGALTAQNSVPALGLWGTHSVTSPGQAGLTGPPSVGGSWSPASGSDGQKPRAHTGWWTYWKSSCRWTPGLQGSVRGGQPVSPRAAGPPAVQPSDGRRAGLVCTPLAGALPSRFGTGGRGVCA